MLPGGARARVRAERRPVRTAHLVPRARTPAQLEGADWIILPGSKSTAADLRWLRAQGLDQAVATHAARGGAVRGICGGLQMLGEALIDPDGIDGNGPGLGLLPLVTVLIRNSPPTAVPSAA